MNRETFIAACQSAFGENFVTPISQVLDVPDSTIRSWVTGPDEIPDAIAIDLLLLLERRQVNISMILDELLAQEQEAANPGLASFLADTDNLKSRNIVPTGSISEDNERPLNPYLIAIAKHIEKIARQCSDAERGEFVTVMIENKFLILMLGSLGQYRVPMTKLSLNAIYDRLRYLSSSKAFIRAVNKVEGYN